MTQKIDVIDLLEILDNDCFLNIVRLLFLWTYIGQCNSDAPFMLFKLSILFSQWKVLTNEHRSKNIHKSNTQLTKMHILERSCASSRQRNINNTFLTLARRDVWCVFL